MGMTEEIKAYILAHVGNPWIDPNVDNANGNIFRDFFPPSSPDRSCVVYQLPGSPPQRGLGNTVMWYNPRLKIVTRTSVSGGFEQAKLDAEHIRDVLHVVTNQTVSGTFYLAIRPSGEPTASALDASSRPSFSTEYEVMKYPSE